jgi:hypothetical protein
VCIKILFFARKKIFFVFCKKQQPFVGKRGDEVGDALLEPFAEGEKMKIKTSFKFFFASKNGSL